MKRLRAYGIEIGSMKTGPLNKITDVPGVTVGHVTLSASGAQTGVTAVLPVQDNLFENKIIGCAHVVNGFGKSTGLVQIEELGTIETPIILTNTLSVGDALKGLVQYKLKRNESIGLGDGTVNGIVCECNDGYLNEIRAFHVKPEDVTRAIQNAGSNFDEGAVGAGKGMSAYGLKGGIGSASRRFEIGGNIYTAGVLVLSNMGKLQNLKVDGLAVGPLIAEAFSSEEQVDKGSIIMVVATDLPVSARQMKRISKRTVSGLSRTGSNMGHGSGEIVIGFSIANRIPHKRCNPFQMKTVHEEDLNIIFEAVAESTEEAILNSMITAETTAGRDGHMRKSLRAFTHLIKADA